MIAAYFRRVLDHPWWAMAACLALTLVAGAGAPGLGFTTAYDAYFSPANPEWQAYQSIEQEFSRAHSVLFAIAPQAGEVFTVDTLNAVRELTEAAWQMPHIKAVSSLTNLHQSYARGDELVVEPLVPDGPLESDNLSRIRERAMNNSRVTGGLLARDGEVTGVSAAFNLPPDEESAVRTIATKARALAAELEAEYPGLRVYQTGSIMLNQAMLDSIAWDLWHLYPPFFIIMFVVLAVFFRGLAATAATLAVLLMSVAVALGAAGWAGVVLNTASIAAAVIILTLAIADCVHILVSFAAARNAGRDPRAAMQESLRVNIQPVFLTTLTTALGFLGMNFSDSPPFQDLGNIVAVGVVAALLFAMTFLPAALMVLPQARVVSRRASLAALDRLADFVIAWRRPLLGVGAVTIVGLTACIPLNQFGDNYIKFFDYSLEFRGHTEFINSELTGLQSIEYPINAGESGGVLDPEFLRNLEKLANWFREQPEVRRVVSVTDLLQRLNKTLHGDDPAYARLPESRQLAAQYLLFFEMSLPQGVGITDLVNLDKSSARLAVILDTIPDQKMVALDERAQAWMAQNLPAEMRVPGSSISIMFAQIARRNFASMLLGTSLAFGFIALVMVFAFKSWRLGLVSLVPNLAPLAMGFGVWGLTVGQTGLATSVVASLTLGIVVDDTVHLLSKYRLARDEKGLLPPAALRDAFANVGVALWLTSLVLMTGFALMILSSFTMPEQMGALTAIIIALALIADFLFLPPLLLVTDRLPAFKSY